MTLSITNFITELGELFRLKYDPNKDYNGLPVRRASAPTTASNLRTEANNKKGANLHMAPDGNLYQRKEMINDSGSPVFEFDGTDIRTNANVSEELTRYDEYVFDYFSSQEKYKHFKLDRYKSIKRFAFSKCINGEPISRRKALSVPELKGAKGCSDRYMKHYYKAMNVALQMEVNNAPIPVEEGVLV